MTEYTPTSWQVLLLWSLIAEGGHGWQKERNWSGIKKHRESLVKYGLLGSRKRSGGYWLEVTAKGWAWAADHLDAELPRTEQAGPVLRLFLTRLKSFLQARELELAEVFMEESAMQADLALSLPATDIKGRIRGAYYSLTHGKSKERVRLHQLRQILSDIERDLLDQALLEMECEEDLVLYSLDNVREITAEDRAAALNTVFGEPRYILYLGV